ncbi:MAG: 2-amino-4-hydroxy-6-hydroxymethyldihydropteridine diphosphokinase [Calditrichaeota bacterium]|nr:2-amino-4-hydroxy-6-hydroxymethyldihydropteridine diphosphokinase [Calditrichota bacterium]
MEKAYLSLGTNVGQREEFLERAIRILSLNSALEIVNISSVYETEPYGVKDQPDFLNLVVEVETSLTPRRLLIVAKSIEEQMGRKPRRRWGPREIDVDILAYEKSVTHEDFLQVPHKELAERRFVLVPFAEIAPGFILPDRNKSIQEMLTECPDTGRVQVYKRLPVGKRITEETS